MCWYEYEQPHAKDKYIIRGAVGIGCLALILLSVGLALPTWFVGYNGDTTTIIATANYFGTCHWPTDATSDALTCVSYSSYECNQSVPLGCQNATVFGCLNPMSTAVSYQYVDAPIFAISINNLYRVRAAGAIGIAGIVMLSISMVLMFILSFGRISPVFLYVPLVLLYMVDVFLVVSLVTGSAVIRYYHVGCGLFVTGTMFTFLFTLFGSFSVGRVHAKRNGRVGDEDPAARYQVT